MVLVFDGKADVPVFGIVAGFLEKELVIHNQPLALFLIQKRFAGLTQAGEILVHVGRFYPNQRYVPDRSFRVVFLRERRRRKQRHENSEPIELLHSDPP